MNNINLNKKNIILIDPISFKDEVQNLNGNYTLQHYQLKYRMNSTLQSIMITNINLKIIRIDDVCLMNEVNLNLMREFVNQEILDRFK